MRRPTEPAPPPTHPACRLKGVGEMALVQVYFTSVPQHTQAPLGGGAPGLRTVVATNVGSPVALLR